MKKSRDNVNFFFDYIEKQNANSLVHAAYTQTQATHAHILGETTVANTEN